jgi:hypothetical protein
MKKLVYIYKIVMYEILYVVWKRNIQSGDFQGSLLRSRDEEAQIQDECMNGRCMGVIYVLANLVAHKNS